MSKFKGKYRIESARLSTWDYGWNGVYFITICTKNREHYLGEIIAGKMQLSEIGGHAEKCWRDIPQHFPFVILGTSVVMPNHVHGIIIINKSDGGLKNAETVETQNLASLPTNPTNPINGPIPQSGPRNKFGPQSQNLASIVRGFKIGVTKFARTNNLPFAWQPRFYDHIIRDDRSFHRISRYIEHNCLNWNEDKFYT